MFVWPWQAAQPMRILWVGGTKYGKPSAAKSGSHLESVANFPGGAAWGGLAPSSSPSLLKRLLNSSKAVKLMASDCHATPEPTSRSAPKPTSRRCPGGKRNTQRSKPQLPCRAALRPKRHPRRRALVRSPKTAQDARRPLSRANHCSFGQCH